MDFPCIGLCKDEHFLLSFSPAKIIFHGVDYILQMTLQACISRLFSPIICYHTLVDIFFTKQADVNPKSTISSLITSKLTL